VSLCFPDRAARRARVSPPRPFRRRRLVGVVAAPRPAHAHISSGPARTSPQAPTRSHLISTFALIPPAHQLHTMARALLVLATLSTLGTFCSSRLPMCFASNGKSPSRNPHDSIPRTPAAMNGHEHVARRIRQSASPALGDWVPGAPASCKEAGASVRWCHPVFVLTRYLPLSAPPSRSTPPSPSTTSPQPSAAWPRSTCR